MWSWSEVSSDGSISASPALEGTLASGSSGTAQLCNLTPDTCYLLSITGASWPHEIKWSMDAFGLNVVNAEVCDAALFCPSECGGKGGKGSFAALFCPSECGGGRKVGSFAPVLTHVGPLSGSASMDSCYKHLACNDVNGGSSLTWYVGRGGWGVSTLRAQAEGGVPNNAQGLACRKQSRPAFD